MKNRLLPICLMLYALSCLSLTLASPHAKLLYDEWKITSIQGTSISIASPDSFQPYPSKTQAPDNRVLEEKWFIMKYKPDFIATIFFDTFSPDAKFDFNAAAEENIVSMSRNMAPSVVIEKKAISICGVRGVKSIVRGKYGVRDAESACVTFMKQGKWYSISTLYATDNRDYEKISNRILQSIK